MSDVELSFSSSSSSSSVDPEVPTLEQLKIVEPGIQLKELVPADIQHFLEDEEFSAKLLSHPDIPESVKEFFRTQRSPVLEAVVPSVSTTKTTSRGSSRALTIKDVLLGVDSSDVEDERTQNTELVKDRRKIKCVAKTENLTQTVEILNSTQLMDRLGSNKNESNNKCAVVLFYAPWCTFSAQAAPHFNALARVFPQLDVYAINAAHFSK